MKDTLIISPTFNEVDNIEKFIDSVFLNEDLSLLIVDDNSPDGTAEIVKEKMLENKNLYLIQRDEKLGLGTAYIAGFKWFLKSKYKYCIQMDCDFSHRFEDLDKLLKNKDAVDLTIGSRYIQGGTTEGWSFRRKSLSKYANLLTKIVLKSKINDLTGGFKCFNREVICEIVKFQPSSNGYTFQIEVNNFVESKNFTTKEVPIIFLERESGVSKMNFEIIFEAINFLLKQLFNVKKNKS
jgi:dolichol-phosphate mannosyltransferase